MLQTLESRRLLSAAVEFEAGTGTLTIVGTDKPDRIEVAVGSAPLNTLDAGGDLAKQAAWFSARSGSYVNVFDSGKLVYQTFLRGETLKHIALDGAGGDDVLLACNFESTVGTSVYGGGGDEQVGAVIFGGIRGTAVYAGEGNDFIQVGGQTKLGFLVWGEDGDDTIVGSMANDTLFGDIDDALVDRPPVYGDDVIYGGDGDDYLCGCGGADAIYGQGGNDFLDGEEGADFIDGGAGDDFAMFDPLDKMINIELMTK